MKSNGSEWEGTADIFPQCEREHNSEKRKVRDEQDTENQPFAETVTKNCHLREACVNRIQSLLDRGNRDQVKFSIL